MTEDLEAYQRWQKFVGDVVCTHRSPQMHSPASGLHQTFLFSPIISRRPCLDQYQRQSLTQWASPVENGLILQTSGSRVFPGEGVNFSRFCLRGSQGRQLSCNADRKDTLLASNLTCNSTVLGLEGACSWQALGVASRKGRQRLSLTQLVSTHLVFGLGLFLFLFFWFGGREVDVLFF